MLKLFSYTLIICFSCLAQAEKISSLYQIDLIVFAHGQDTSLSARLPSSILPVDLIHTIPLGIEISKHKTPYHLLPSSFSQLREAYWALHRKSQYRLLAHYSWLQPMTNQRSVALPKINREGWQVEGKLRVHRSNYYLFDTELLFSNNNQTPFIVAQKQRLKEGETYYLDHPQAGILIKIHQPA